MAPTTATPKPVEEGLSLRYGLRYGLVESPDSHQVERSRGGACEEGFEVQAERQQKDRTEAGDLVNVNHDS